MGSLFGDDEKKGLEIKGTVVLQRKPFMQSNVKDFGANVADWISEAVGRKVVFQLVSRDQIGSGKGKVSLNEAYLDWDLPSGKVIIEDEIHEIIFYWPPEFGTPGALLIKNGHPKKFFLKHVYIDVPGEGRINFLCNSWVYPSWKARFRSHLSAQRIFFANNSYLPKETPIGLDVWRREELKNLRGDDATGMRKPYESIYDYDVYNDLGDPDNDKMLQRTVLGGSQEFPYPRRCRTGRERTITSRAFETRQVKNEFYVPPDEKLPRASLSDFRAHSIKAFSTKFLSNIASSSNGKKKHFDNLKEVIGLYTKGLSWVSQIAIRFVKEVTPDPMIKQILDTQDQAILQFPVPNIISEDDNAWMKDEEFARQTLSGVNPMVIQCLQRFPLYGNLNEEIYGPQESSITAQDLHPYLDGMMVEKAIELKRLFTLDYYDAYMPYVERINQLTTSKVYATRTIFVLLSNGTLMPIAIELCLPPTSVELGERRVFTPDYSEEDAGWLWHLAKAHVRANDSGYHQIVSHWLRTHAVVEPFIIATHRQLSKLHPLHKLLIPHFHNTMDINRAARENLINAGGIIEKCFSPGRFAMEISAKAYMEWRFNEQGLPADLLKRGMALPEPTDERNGLKLVIEDYPYAVDGLEIWDALKSWVSDYTSLYYANDQTIESDKEVQAWWEEIINIGHGDKKHDQAGWYKMNTFNDLKEAITTIIWLASAHHAAVNFGQYGYAGFMPNLPSTTREFVPHKGSHHYSEFLKDPETYFVKTLPDPETTTTTMAVLEILSKHFRDENYLGQGSTSDWVDDPPVEEAFQQFRYKLLNIERNIIARNDNPSLKNRCGSAKLPYTLLFPNTSDETKTGGLIFKGIPTSISI